MALNVDKINIGEILEVRNFIGNRDFDSAIEILEEELPVSSQVAIDHYANAQELKLEHDSLPRGMQGREKAIQLNGAINQKMDAFEEAVSDLFD